MNDYFLADDLSGALDAAAAFHRAGRRVTIMLSPEDWPDLPLDDVVGLTTETRNAEPAAAAKIVRRVIEHARERGARLVYKKIDSTLRGPVAAELNALGAALPASRILFLPANPAAGRTVRDGILFVHGVPLAETEFARDPAWPVTESAVRRLLGPAADDRIVVADASSADDLTAAVARMEHAGSPWIGVGSGALARPLAALHARPADAIAASRRGVAAGPALMVSGSAHPGNRAQAAALAGARDVALHAFRLAEPDAAMAAAREDLQAGRGAAVLVEETRRDSAAVVRAIAAGVAGLLAETGTGRLFVTGGETAFAICRALGIAALTFDAEIEPGLGLSRGQSRAGELLLAVKPGGFGDAQSWIRAWDALVAN